MSDTQYSDPVMVDEITGADGVLSIPIYMTEETTIVDGATRTRKRYKYSFRRDLRRSREDGTPRLAYSYFKWHTEHLMEMLPRVEERISKLELIDKYGK